MFRDVAPGDEFAERSHLEPPVETIDFNKDSFFREHVFTFPLKDLPSPEQVRAKYGNNGGIAIFEELNLVVKFGHPSRAPVGGALATYAVRKAFSDAQVPVPELLGWQKDAGQNFIYMSRVPGLTIRESWPLLTRTDKESICDQLREILDTLHTGALSKSADTWIGSVNRGPMLDNSFDRNPDTGPFVDVHSFNDRVQELSTGVPNTQRTWEDPYRELLPDESPIRFCHADIHIGNVLVQQAIDGSWKVSGIIDWDQAGYYPEYWEYCKIHLGCEEDHEWRSDGWADRLMKNEPNAFIALAQYWIWRGP